MPCTQFVAHAFKANQCRDCGAQKSTHGDVAGASTDAAASEKPTHGRTPSKLVFKEQPTSSLEEPKKEAEKKPAFDGPAKKSFAAPTAAAATPAVSAPIVSTAVNSNFQTVKANIGTTDQSCKGYNAHAFKKNQCRDCGKPASEHRRGSNSVDVPKTEQNTGVNNVTAKSNPFKKFEQASSALPAASNNKPGGFNKSVNSIPKPAAKKEACVYSEHAFKKNKCKECGKTQSEHTAVEEPEVKVSTAEKAAATIRGTTAASSTPSTSPPAAAAVAAPAKVEAAPAAAPAPVVEKQAAPASVQAAPAPIAATTPKVESSPPPAAASTKPALGTAAVGISKCERFNAHAFKKNQCRDCSFPASAHTAEAQSAGEEAAKASAAPVKSFVAPSAKPAAAAITVKTSADSTPSNAAATSKPQASPQASPMASPNRSTPRSAKVDCNTFVEGSIVKSVCQTCQRAQHEHDEAVVRRSRENSISGQAGGTGSGSNSATSSRKNSLTAINPNLYGVTTAGDKHGRSPSFSSSGLLTPGSARNSISGAAGKAPSASPTAAATAATEAEAKPEAESSPPAAAAPVVQTTGSVSNALSERIKRMSLSHNGGAIPVMQPGTSAPKPRGSITSPTGMYAGSDYHAAPVKAAPENDGTPQTEVGDVDPLASRPAGASFSRPSISGRNKARPSFSAPKFQRTVSEEERVQADGITVVSEESSEKPKEEEASSKPKAEDEWTVVDEPLKSSPPASSPVDVAQSVEDVAVAHAAVAQSTHLPQDATTFFKPAGLASDAGAPKVEDKPAVVESPKKAEEPKLASKTLAPQEPIAAAVPVFFRPPVAATKVESPKAAAAPAASTKTAASLFGDDDDGDDMFATTKKPAAAAAAPAAAAPVAAPVVPITATPASPAAAAAPKRKASLFGDDDDDFATAPPASLKSLAKDDDDGLFAKKAPTPAAAAVPPKKTASLFDEEDGDLWK
jgi:hypothetical protein